MYSVSLTVTSWRKHAEMVKIYQECNKYYKSQYFFFQVEITYYKVDANNRKVRVTEKIVNPLTHFELPIELEGDKDNWYVKPDPNYKTCRFPFSG